MSIDWNAFTPGSALAGGVLIGLAASMLILGSGRIAGISGIVGGLLRPVTGEIRWRIAFLLGLIGTPLIFVWLGHPPALDIDAGFGGLVAAGLLVGFGSRYSQGCTSGHGVCGVSRGSLRSVVATVTFVAAGFVTVFVVRHLLAG